MNEAFITSPYGSNQTNSIASLLKAEGYYTAFFHGGSNGTMGFDAFANLAGFDDYFGRIEYNNEADYDGNWGIWDEEFFQFTAKTLNQKKQPFFATLFTLTSHHPYLIPAKYNGKFKKGDTPIKQSIAYSDFALRQFFETVKKMPWFKNTLFVFCADHTGISSDEYYLNRIGNYAIPILYYFPNGDLKGLNKTVTQQIDIMPSILDYLNYPKAYYSFGNSVFDTAITHNALMYYNDVFQLVSTDYFIEFTGNKATCMFNVLTDSVLKNNLILTQPNKAKDLENIAKAVIQTYQHDLITNTQRVIINK
jgi:phosphoglycerol transferase MdoB-like AlkP superfamily enzyme